MRIALILTMPLCVVAASAGRADDLYRGSNWSAFSADDKATRAGDLLTIVIYQQAEATNVAQNNSRKKTDVGGSFKAGSIGESASLDFGGGYSGRGEVKRSERFVTQLTVKVQEVLPNGDLIVVGEQWMKVNGERTQVGVRGRVRRADISSSNTILSTRIADAQIDYDGRGFVSRSAKPGLINRIFSFLGLG